MGMPLAATAYASCFPWMSGWGAVGHLVPDRCGVAAGACPGAFRVTPAVHCVRAENLNGLVFLFNGCDQEVRAFWCAELQTDTGDAVTPASCAALAAAESKAVVEIKAQQSTALAVPVLGGNLLVAQVRQVHIAACPIRTRDVNVPHHFELSYSANAIVSKCLEQAVLEPGQRSRLVEIQLVPERSPVQVRLIDPSK